MTGDKIHSQSGNAGTTGKNPKVFAVNASPRRDKGNTELILNPFLEGMKKAGAEIEMYYIRDLQIQPCREELACMFRPDGRCIHRDDMDTILPRIRDADILVLATPLCFDGVAGPLKILMDRMLPLLQIFIENRDGHCRHQLRDPKSRQLVLVSSCGFWELDNFGSLVAHMQAFAINISAEYSGSLLRPHASSFHGMLVQGAPVQDIPDAARRAGERLVQDGTIAASLLETISRPLVPRDTYIEESNRRYAELIQARQVSTGGPSLSSEGSR